MDFLSLSLAPTNNGELAENVTHSEGQCSACQVRWLPLASRTFSMIIQSVGGGKLEIGNGTPIWKRDSSPGSSIVRPVTNVAEMTSLYPHRFNSGPQPVEHLPSNGRWVKLLCTASLLKVRKIIQFYQKRAGKLVAGQEPVSWKVASQLISYHWHRFFHS